MALQHNQTGYCSSDYWSAAKRVTLGMSLKQAASRAGLRYVAAMDHDWLNDKITPHCEVREIIGEKLLKLGCKPVA